MGIVAVLLASFVAAGYMRRRRVRALAAIFAAGLIVPAAVAFTSFIYPADPEARMWAMIAMPVSYVWGLVAAGLGYGLVSLALRGRGDA